MTNYNCLIGVPSCVALFIKNCVIVDKGDGEIWDQWGDADVVPYIEFEYAEIYSRYFEYCKIHFIVSPISRVAFSHNWAFFMRHIKGKSRSHRAKVRWRGFRLV